MPKRAVDWAALARPSLAGIEPYDPGATRDELAERHGLDALHPLNWNEDLFGPPDEVLAAARDEIARAPLYPERAYADFRSAVAESIGVPAAAVVPAHGAQALIGALASVFVDAGTSVVIPRPTYGLYAQVSAAGGGVVTRVESTELAFDLDAIAAAAREASARLIWLCDPNNPTGLAIGRHDWERFLDRVPADCVVVVDEAYGDFVDPAVRVRREHDVLEGRPVVVIRSFSKIFGLAGLRLGYAVCDPAVAAYLNVVQEPFNVNRVALAAGRTAVGMAGFVAERRAQVARARELFAAALEGSGARVVPSQSNFVLVHLGRDERPVCDELMRQGILIRPGSTLGLPGTVRVTMAPDRLVHAAAEAIAAAVAGAAR